MTSLTVRQESWPLRSSFAISRGRKTTAEVVVAEIEQGGARGRGECVPYAHYGESVEAVVATIEAMAGALAEGLDREGLQKAMPAGGARNALDCAFWDLEAKRSGRRAWSNAGLGEPAPLETAYTLSLDTPERMGAAAADNAHRPALKLKLAGEGDLERVGAVRAGAPDARLIVDANEGWTAEEFIRFAPSLADLGVAMIEQPLPAGQDEALADLDRPVPVCADEACHDRASLADLAGRYDMINIKLDKTGGLTEALALREAAEQAGMEVMVGCMIGTSLSMAPAILVAQGAAVVDLDGPLLLAKDREDGLIYRSSIVEPPSPRLWG